MAAFTFILPNDSSKSGIMKNQVENRPAYQILKSYFEKQGFEFLSSRSQVFLSFDKMNPKSAPSIFTIIPSLVPVDLSKDPSHRAIGIIVLRNKDKYAYLAVEVLCNHKPYSIDTYTIYSLHNTKKEVVKIASIGKADIGKSEVNTITSKIVINLDRIGNPEMLDISLPAEDISGIIKTALSNLLNDEFTKKFPIAYKNAMLKETPMIEKFSRSMAIKKGNSEASRFACSCTCCNGCTTTSSSFSLSYDKGPSDSSR